MPDGELEKAAEYVNLEFNGVTQLGNTNLKIANIWTAFTVMGLD